MDLIQPLAAVVLVMALLGGLLFMLKRRGVASFHLPGPIPSPRRLQVLERVPLTAQHALHLVKAEDRILLIATSPDACQILEPGSRT